MSLYHHHFKKSDSWMWINWVRHDGFGKLPHLSVRKVKHDLYFYFDFTWWKLNCYWVKGLNKPKYKQELPRMEEYADLNDYLKAVSKYYELCEAAGVCRCPYSPTDE